MDCIGLVGGLGVGAACHYYKVLAQKYPRDRGSMELCMVHADMAVIFDCVGANEPERLANYLVKLIDRLRGAGATVVAIPAVTPHFSIPELKLISPLPIVDLLDVIAREIHQRGLMKVAIFGTKYVMESNLFGSLASIAEAATLSAEEHERIHALYLRLATRGVAESTDISELNEMAASICERERVDAVLLAGTDFAVVPTGLLSLPHLDCTDAHLWAILQTLGTPS